MTDISIAMATYNGAQFIGEQLQSLANQTLLPREVVIADDCSTDNVLDVVEKFAADAPFPIYLQRNPKQLGYRENFMKAASLCQSEIVAFCDQDDVWLPQKLEKCATLFDNKDVLFVYHNALAVTSDLQPLGDMAFRGAPQLINPPLSLDPWKYGLGFTQLMRRDLLAYYDYWTQSADFNDNKNPEAHDEWFSFLSSCLGTIGYIAEPLVLYRRHASTATVWGNGGGIAGKWRNLMSTRRTRMASFETAAARRASILEQLQGKQAARAKVAAVLWRKIEYNHRCRKEMYLSSPLLVRLGKFAKFMHTGVYGPLADGGAGHKELLRDIVRGVLFPASS